MNKKQRNKFLHNKSGFSLMEILVVISIMSLIMFVGADFIKTSLKTSRYESEQETAIQEARKAMKTVERDVRMVNDSALGGYAIAVATAQNLEIFSNINQTGDDITEKVRFFIDGTTNELKKVVTNFNIISQTYTGTKATTTVSRYVNNQAEPLFYYYDNNGNSTSRIEDIRRISFSIKINVTPMVMPNDYYVVADVTLRNLKDNL